MSHVIHENVEEYQTEDLNPLVSCLIPHSASLRYIFMMLPLFLVLVPEASADKMTEIRNDYDKLLVHVINHLEKLISRNITSNCNIRICDPHSCAVKILHQNATLDFLTSCLKIKANCTKISHLKNSMNHVSELTSKIVNKIGYTLQPFNHSHQCYRQCRKNIRKCDWTHTFCGLKNIVSALSVWWKKFVYYGYSLT